MIRVRRTLPETRLSNPTTQLPVIQPVPVTFKMSTIASGADGQGVEGGAGGVESMGIVGGSILVFDELALLVAESCLALR